MDIVHAGKCVLQRKDSLVSFFNICSLNAAISMNRLESIRV